MAQKMSELVEKQEGLYYFNLKTLTYSQTPKTISSVRFLTNSQTSGISKVKFLLLDGSTLEYR